MVVSRRVVEVSNYFHISASGSLSSVRRARHVKILLIVVVAHFISAPSMI